VTSYVADELIDWSAAPDDPIYRLVVPGGDMPREAGAGQAAGSLSPGRARRRPGEQVLPGVHRSYHDTVSVFAPPGPAGSFGTTCPGRDRPASGPGPVMPAGDVPRLAGYLAAHPEVSVVEFAGADPLTMNTSALRHFIEPLLAAEHLVSVRLRTAALACWPYRFTEGSDADELLRLFDQVSAGDKTLALIADLSHPRELEPDPAREAVRRIRSTRRGDLRRRDAGRHGQRRARRVGGAVADPGPAGHDPPHHGPGAGYRPENAFPGDAGPGAADLRHGLRQRLGPGPYRPRTRYAR
jgi:L-lysine 2,3-aminomutase